MPAVSSLLRPRLLSAGALAAVGLLVLTGCAGTAGPGASSSGGSGSVGPTASATSSAPVASPTSAPPSETQATPTGAKALPFGQEQWVVGTLTRGGKPVDTGPWKQAFIETEKPFMFAAAELCSQPRFGITKVSETAWEATHDVAQPAIACAEAAPGQKAVGALWELFDGTVKVTPPAGASMEMRLERGDVVLVLGIEG